MVVNITFLSFLLFSMCKSIHDAVNTWINCSFFILILITVNTESYFSPRINNSPSTVSPLSWDRRINCVIVSHFSFRGNTVEQTTIPSVLPQLLSPSLRYYRSGRFQYRGKSAATAVFPSSPLPCSSLVQRTSNRRSSPYQRHHYTNPYVIVIYYYDLIIFLRNKLTRQRMSLSMGTMQHFQTRSFSDSMHLVICWLPFDDENSHIK